MKLRHRFTGVLDLQRQADARELQRMLKENFAELELRAGREWVTSLPKNPDDGAEVVYVADLASGVTWPLRYESTTGYWLAAGPTPLYNFAPGDASHSVVGSYQNTGLTLSLPLQGDYDIECGGFGWASVIVGNTLSYAVGAAAAVDDDGCDADGTAGYSVHSLRRKTIAAANTVLTQQSKNRSGVAATLHWARRFLRATPILVK